MCVCVCVFACACEGTFCSVDLKCIYIKRVLVCIWLSYVWSREHFFYSCKTSIPSVTLCVCLCVRVCVSGREGVIKVKIVHDAGECLCVRDSISHL